jgi:NitT/TauT family transport system substrate-binding protein
VKRLVARLAVVSLSSLVGLEAAAQSDVRVGICGRSVTVAAAPFAIATKLGWYAKSGIKVELVHIPGSTDCIKFVATRDVAYALPSVEPLAIIRAQGVKAKTFYTAYQGYIYGIAVPRDSTIKRFADLKGKSVGVASMGSAGVVVARALAANAGLDPDRDVRIVVAGEGVQPAALLRAGQIDALSQYDIQYALIENAGIKLRLLPSLQIERFPSNGLVALEETLRTKRKQAVALAQGYAKGTLFAMANPDAAIRLLWEVYPQSKATGKDEATALRDDVKVLAARIENWKLEKGGVSKWGESSERNYASYVEFLHKWGILKDKVAVRDLITNDLIAEINDFDQAKIIAEAKAYKAR